MCKVIGAGKTLFPRGEKGLGVERRAGKLTKEYKSVLIGYNVRFPRRGPHGARAARAGGLPLGGEVLVLLWSV